MPQELEQLIKQCIEGKERAQYELYKQLYGKLMTICKRYESNNDDALSMLNAGFYKVLTNLKKYNTEKPFEPWAMRVQINVILDQYRRDKRFRQEVSESFEIPEIQLDHEVLNDVEQRIEAEHLEQMMESLPKATKAVFYLHAVEGFEYDEISEELKISKGTIKWHVSKAREVLKSKLSEFVRTSKSMMV